MRWWKILLASLLLISVLALAACSPKTAPEAEAMPTIRLSEVTRSIFYAPLYVALANGYFEEEGVNIELSTAFGGDKVMTYLLTNEADVGFVGAETSIYVYQQGSSDVILNFFQLTQRDGQFLVAREPIENFSWEMIRGKTMLGQRKGGMPEMVAEYVEAKNGIIPHVDVEIIQNVDFANLGSAFASGVGDFAHLFEPVAALLEREGKAYVVASLGVESGILPYTCFMAKTSYLEKNGDAIQKFANALQRGLNYVHRHTPEEIANVIAPYFEDTDMDILITVVKRYKDQDTWPTNGVIIPDGLENLQNIMANAGELKERVPYEAIVTTKFAEKACELYGY
ncbi:MAG TPA: ABC transporter substrate-binding protein [Clostridia bacterium]|nr:ABC transporter substrate-binding protein [Clostridia bacterium]